MVDRRVDDNGIKQIAVLSELRDASAVTPCWSLADGDRSCRTTEQHLEISRGDAPVPAGLMTAIDCGSTPLP